MTLPVPVVSVDTGPDWANNLNSCLSAIDSHDHTPGKGVALTPSSFSITSDLSMGGNSLISTKSVVFQAQSSLSTLDAIYVIGVDLYYNDGSGNVVRITQGGNVAGSTGTITGLPSGTASASYQSGGGTFQFQSATNTPANISGASVLISEQVASPNFITLASPTSLAASYTVTYPSGTPGSTGIVRMDTSGALSNNLLTDNSTLEISSNTLRVKDGGITAAKIANLTITAAQIAADAITTVKILNANVTAAKIEASPRFTTSFGASGFDGIFGVTAGTSYTIGSGNLQNTLALGYSGQGAGYRIICGEVSSTGTLVGGEGFTPGKSGGAGTGVYTVTPTIASASRTIKATVSPVRGGQASACISSQTGSVLNVNTYVGASAADVGFSFILVLEA